MAAGVQYLTVADAVTLHRRIMTDMGEPVAALRDEGALESALMRPRMAAHYEDADLVSQATLLMTGIALAHPFVDGNKRAAFLCGDVFLQINGLWLDADGIAAAEQLVAVLTRDDSLDVATLRLAEWMRARVQPLT